MKGKSAKLPKIMERCLGVHSPEDLRKIRGGRVAIAGVGCDGCEVAEQLVRTGVGRITLIDHDVVEESNLNRQRLFSMKDVGVPKVVAAKRRLEEISPHTKISIFHEKLGSENGEKLLKGHDVIAQGMDSITGRITAHEDARKLGLPIVTMTGQPPLRSFVSTCTPASPSYEKLFGIRLEKRVIGMSAQEKKELDRVMNIERAEHAISRGADIGWYESLKRGEAGWSITLGRSPVTGTMQANEIIRLMTGKKPLAVAPKAIICDGNGLAEFGMPESIAGIMKPPNGKYWDYRLF